MIYSVGGKYPNIVLNLIALQIFFIFHPISSPHKSFAVLYFNYSNIFYFNYSIIFRFIHFSGKPHQ